MRVLVVGASGGVGRLVVEQALEAGHQVTAVLRDPTSTALPSGAEVQQGDVLDPERVMTLVAGHDVVISCVGHRRASVSNPWSRPLTATDTIERGTRHLLAAMKAHRVPRILFVSAAGVADSEPQMPWLFAWTVRHSTIGYAYADLARAEQLLRDSGLDWMSVRPAALYDGPCKPRIEVLRPDQYAGWAWISRADVAAWLVRHIGAPAPLEPRTPTIRE